MHNVDTEYNGDGDENNNDGTMTISCWAMLACARGRASSEEGDVVALEPQLT